MSMQDQVGGWSVNAHWNVILFGNWHCTADDYAEWFGREKFESDWIEGNSHLIPWVWTMQACMWGDG